jgi:glycosyltransferase involved in cell wall biosynthesis
MLYRRADLVIAVSESVKRFVIEIDRLPADRIVVVPHGVAPAPVLDPGEARGRRNAMAGIPHDARLVGAAGRLIEAKGFDDLLAAFADVRSRHPSVHLAIAGEGPLRRMLESGAGERVHFMGWMPEIHPFLAALDVFVAPSRREGFGLSVLEAMQHERPVIVSDAGALPEIVADGETGLVVPSRDPRSLARAIVRLIEDEALRWRLGRAAALHVNTAFTIHRMAEATAAVYNRLLGPPM